MTEQQYVLCDDLGLRLDENASPELRRALHEWLAPFAATAEPRPVALTIRDASLELPESFRAGQVETDGASVRVEQGRVLVEFTLGRGDSVFACRATSESSRWPLVAVLRRMVNGETSAAMAQALSYYGLWSVLHLALLPRDHGFTHGGCVVDESARSHLVIGAGGSGKTSTTLSLIERHGWRYQAEDLALLDGRGQTYLSPRPLTVYRSDVRWGSALLASFEDGLPLTDKFGWHLAAWLRRNPRRRVRYDRLFQGPQVAKAAAELSTVHFIRRTGAPGVFGREDVTPEAMAEHALAVSMRELAPLYEPLVQTHGAFGPQVSGRLRLESIFSDTRMLYRRAFQEVRCVRITASRDVAPDQIAELIARDG